MAMAAPIAQLTHIRMSRQSFGPCLVAWTVLHPPVRTLSMAVLKMNFRIVASVFNATGNRDRSTTVPQKSSTGSLE